MIVELVHLLILFVTIKPYTPKQISVSPYQPLTKGYFGITQERLTQSSIKRFPWNQHLNLNPNPNWQDKEFTKVFLNIMSNNIPQATKKILPRDEQWKTKPLKSMINRKDRFYKNYKRHGCRKNDKVSRDNFRLECQQAIEKDKKAYMTNLGNKLYNLHTS